MRAKKILGIFDTHFGWEKAHEKGRWVTRPTHALPAIKATMRFAEDFGPDVLVLAGDQLNAGPVSHWHHGKPILSEGFRLKDEMDLLDEHLLTPLEDLNTLERKIWHDGNHEDWITQHVEANPGLAGLIEPQNYLKLEKRGYELNSVGEVSQVGKLHFVHGDVVLRRGGGVHPARKLVLAYRRNIRAGHVHYLDATTEVTAVDSQDYHTGVTVPSLSTRNPSYNRNAPTTHMQGFLYGYVWPDGSFNDHVVVINKDTFTVNGKRYHGR